jgi:fructose-specific phosphotransferase system IIA component
MERIIVSDYMSLELITDLKATTKDEALKEMLELISRSSNITDKKQFEDAIFKREKLMSTGIGYGIAVPHAKVDGVKDFTIALGRSASGIEYESIDDKPVHLIFMIGASDTQDKEYIRLLSRLVLRLKDKNLIKQLLKAKNTEEIFNLISEN